MGRINKVARRVMHAALVEVGINKVILIIAVVLLALVAAVTLGFRQSIMTVNRLDRQAEQVLVANYLKRQGIASIGQQKVQLTWDDAFNAAAHRVDPVWADTYLGGFLHSNFRYDLIYLVDPQGRLLRSWENGKPGGAASYQTFAPAVRTELSEMADNTRVYGKPAEFRALADTRWPFDARGNALTRWAMLPVAIAGRSGQLTVASIVPDTRMEILKRTPNHLVAVRFYDAAYLQELRADLLLNPVTSSLTEPAGPEANGLALADHNGLTQGWLTWKFSARGEVVQERMRPLFMAFVCIMLALLACGASILRGLSRAHDRLRENESAALFQAHHDGLTGLVNREHFLERLDATMQGIEADGDQRVALAFFDLDNFKFVNDTLGHPAGDELLRQVAQRCTKRLPSGDLLARLGGDEFVLMRTSQTSQGVVSGLGQELMALFAAPFKVDGRIIDVTASCGIAWAPEHGSNSEDLLRKADIALYQAKHRGRARWRGFTPDMAAKVSYRAELESELRKALHGDALSMAYQPIVRASDGEIEGAEALLRWNHPKYGAVSPGLFVPVAEQAGLMPLLGWWTLGRVFEQQRAFPHHNVSINLSPLQLTARGFLDDLAVLVEEYRVRPEKVTFEVTEGILLERTSGVFDVLAGLRAMGFGIALDDFGTGYSSLSYLRTFRFDRIKIDRSFIQNIENERDAQAILKTIVSLGRTLDSRTVAEGVETLLQRELVVAAGCELIQGYYHHYPMSLEEFVDLLVTEQNVPQLRRAG